VNSSLFPTCAFTATEEGGYSADPGDNGNFYDGLLIGSNLGVTPQDLADAGMPVTRAFMQALTPAIMTPIFARKYWNVVYADHLSLGVDAITADFGYNAGNYAAGLELQTVLGLADADRDGWIGPETAAAATAFVAPATMIDAWGPATIQILQSHLRVVADGKAGPITRAALAADPHVNTVSLVCALHAAHLAHYATLVQFPRYGVGWDARAGRCLALAFSLISAGV